MADIADDEMDCCTELANGGCSDEVGVNILSGVVFVIDPMPAGAIVVVSDDELPDGGCAPVELLDIEVLSAKD